MTQMKSKWLSVRSKKPSRKACRMCCHGARALVSRQQFHHLGDNIIHLTSLMIVIYTDYKCVLRQVCWWRTMVTSLGWSWSQRLFAHVSPAMVEIQVHRAKFRSNRVRSHLSWGLLRPPNSTPADSTPVHLWTPHLCACGQTRDVGYVWLPDTLHLLHQRILKEDAKWKPKETGSYDFYFGIILESQQK